MNALNAFQPRYLKAGDLNGKPTLVHIERVQTRNDVFDPQAQAEVTRHILHLVNGPKGFMLNKTQTMAVIAITGQEDTDNWVGHTLVLHPITNEVNMPTIQIAAFDPAEAATYGEFPPKPVRQMATGAQVRQQIGGYPAVPPPYVGNRAILVPEAPATRQPKRQAQAAAAD